MPRLPVTWTAQAMGLLLAVTLAPPPALAAPAKQPSVETLMYHLKRDPQVFKATKNYKVAVQGAMLYYKCPTEYKVDDVKRTRQDTVLHEAMLALREAFSDAHRRLTKKLPGNDVIAVTQKYAETLREKTAIDTGKVIGRRGCTTGNFRALDQYFENVAAEKNKPTKSRNQE